MSQTICLDGTKITSFHIGYVASKEEAQPFVDAIDGETFMNFRVLVCPAGGCFGVVVETHYDGTEEEIQGMLSYLMFSEICEKGF